MLQICYLTSIVSRASVKDTVAAHQLTLDDCANESGHAGPDLRPTERAGSEQTGAPATSASTKAPPARADRATMRAMNDHGYAIDLYIGELARQGRTEATRLKYTEVLYQFADHMERLGRAPWETTTNDCRHFLDASPSASPGRRPRLRR